MSSDPGFHTAGPLIYRLLRPLTVAGLIVHRTRQSDLALDNRVVKIVRFHNAAFDMLTREEVLTDLGLEFRERGYSTRQAEVTDRPFERIRDSCLRSAADALSIPDEGDRRCMTHAEFLERWEDLDPGLHEDLRPITTVIDKFDPRENPVFWLRLVGYSYTCHWYLRQIEEDAEHERKWYARERIEYNSPEIRDEGTTECGEPR